MNELRRVPEPVRVVRTPGVMGGQPCLSNTRIPAEIVLLYLRDGATRQEIYADYPHLPVGAIEAVAEWAEAEGLDVSVPD